MLRQTLSNMVEQVRNECAMSSSTSRGIDHLEHIQQIIRRVYYSLAEDFDWEHLKLKRDDATAGKALSAGANHYDFPTGINPTKIDAAWVRWGNSWSQLNYGISRVQYSAYDSNDNSKRVDPVTHWDYYGGQGAAPQFEVWPIPASNGALGGYEVAFEGQAAVEQLTGNNSRADIDDILIVLNAAGEILAADDEAMAKVKLGAAGRRFSTVRGNMSDKSRIQIGLGSVSRLSRTYPRRVDFVR